MSDIGQHDHRLTALREQLVSESLGGWYVGREDMYQGEEVQAGDERLAYLCGFTGSAGFAIVLQDQAALFSDGRYTLQMTNQTNPAHWTTHTMPEASLAKWLEPRQAEGVRIGVDTRLVTVATYERLEKTLSAAGALLVDTQTNPIDAIWQDRPGPPPPQPFRFDIATAGVSMAAKLEQLDSALAKANCDAVFLSRVDAVNWLANIRGRDLECTPIMHAFALYHRENGLILLADPGRLAPVMQDDLAAQASVVSLADFAKLIDPRAGYTDATRVMIEAASLPRAVYDVLTQSGVELVRAACPVTRAKSVKNRAELAGTRRAHIEDGGAMVRFLTWLDTVQPGTLTETEIADHLLAIRKSSPRFLASSFTTICGAGPNGAIVHYRAIEGADSALVNDSLLLVDSGAHYNDGTTDITRTMLIGNADAKMRHAFTSVLQGHIAVATARFPQDTTGQQIDVIARHPMWAEGLDFAHGTGHGVGHVMQVHEGPASISKRGTEPLVPGMLLSNEPGYYLSDKWGIRIENLIVVTPPDEDGFLGFETVTFCPIDRRLVDVDMLNPAEREWLNAYHQQVKEMLIPELQDDEAAQAWLVAACAAL